MIIDYQNRFSTEQAVTSSAASTNVIDLGVAGNMVGDEPMIVAQVQTTFDSVAEDSTMALSVQTSVDEAFTSPITLMSTPVIAEATLVAGYEPLKVKMPLGLKRYVRLYFTVAGTGAFTTGKLNAFITPNAEVRA
jgi:hypothetical protein